MKKVGLVIIGLVFFKVLFTQEYFPIVQENKEWNMLSVGYNSTFTDTIYTTWTFKFEGDTLINNINYLKVYVSYDSLSSEWIYECCVREDSDKKVYKNKWETDYLIYDFGIEIGDTIVTHYQYGASIELVVEAIDLVEIDGNLRKKFILDYSQSDHYETWIEGIGSNRGILQAGTANFVGGWRWLMCMSESGQLIYMSPNFNSCYLTSTGRQDNFESKIQIFPNPAIGRIQIQSPSNLKIECISLIDLSGQIKKQFYLVEEILSISKIPSGLYILKIEHKNGLVIKKIIIN
jgi:hypothetical protein